MVRIPENELAALDVWRAQDAVMVAGRSLSRPEALRRLAVETLQGLGVMSIEKL